MSFKEKYKMKGEEDPEGKKKEISNEAYAVAELLDKLYIKLMLLERKYG